MHALGDDLSLISEVNFEIVLVTCALSTGSFAARALLMNINTGILGLLDRLTGRLSSHWHRQVD